MMKKKMMVLTGLLMAVVITAYSVSGTYAKYTSTFDGATSTATVAKWAFQIKSNGTTETEDFTFDLFSTIKDTDGTTDETDVGVWDEDAQKVVNDHLIAPGTSGQFDLAIANLSEVTAKITLSADVTNTSNIPLEFSIDNGTTWENDLTELLAAKYDTDGTLLSGYEEILSLNPDANAATPTIQWRWAFDDATTPGKNDKRDTDLGTATTAPTITVTLHVTATQVD